MTARLSALRWALARKIAPVAIQPVPPGMTLYFTAPGSSPSAIIEIDGKVSGDVAQRLALQWKAAYR